MFRFFGPLLLLGLGLCAASGCALSGPNRISGLAQRLPWGGDVTPRQEPAAQESLSFRAPARRVQEDSELPAVTAGSSVARGEASSSPLLAGHSTDRVADPRERSSPSLRLASSSMPRSNLGVVPAGHEQLALAQTIEPLAGEVAAPSRVMTANYRSDRDALDAPVQLQGFEPIEPVANATTAANPNELPLWANRPVAKPVSPTSKSVGQVQPVSAQVESVVPPGPWQADLERLIARAERDVAGLKPGSTPETQAEYRRRLVHLRLLYLMAERQEQALTAIPGLESAEQEYWQQLCWAASNSLDAEQFPSLRDRAAQSIAPLNTALRRLREQSDLAIKNIAFCEQISYFGNYQKFSRNEFTPGQEVLLYSEIENFNTEQTTEGEHRTLLRSVIDIVGSNGEARWHKTFPSTEDRCRNPRRDYFHNYQFAIPDRLPLGPHTLKLTVVDDLSGKQASYSLNFLVK